MIDILNRVRRARLNARTIRAIAKAGQKRQEQLERSSLEQERRQQEAKPGERGGEAARIYTAATSAGVTGVRMPRPAHRPAPP